MIKNKLTKTIVIFNLVITPLVFVPNQIVFDYFYYPKYVVLMISSLLLLIPLWVNRLNVRKLLVWDTVNKLLFAYMLFLSISVFFAYDPMIAISGSFWRQEGLVTILFYIMLFLAARSIGDLDEKFFVAMIFSAVLVSMYGIAQFFGFDFVLREYFRSPNTPISTIGNQNFIGSYMVLILPITLKYWFTQKKKIALLAYSIILFGLLTTMSRGPWVGFAVSIIVFLMINDKLNKIPLVSKANLILLTLTLGVVFVFTLISDVSFFARLSTISHDITEIINNSSEANYAGSWRWFIWQKTLILIKNHPWFGIGIENLGIVFPREFSNDIIKNFGFVVNIDKAHNEYLDQMVSSGIPSVTIYLAFLFSILRSGYQRLNVDPMKIALMSSIIGYLVQAFFNIRVVSVAYIFWIFLALILNSPRELSQESKT